MSERIKAGELQQGEFILLDGNVYRVPQVKYNSKFVSLVLVCAHSKFKRTFLQVKVGEFVDRMTKEEVEPHRSHPNSKLTADSRDDWRRKAP